MLQDSVSPKSAALVPVKVAPVTVSVTPLILVKITDCGELVVFIGTVPKGTDVGLTLHANPLVPLMVKTMGEPVGPVYGKLICAVSAVPTAALGVNVMPVMVHGVVVVPEPQPLVPAIEKSEGFAPVIVVAPQVCVVPVVLLAVVVVVPLATPLVTVPNSQVAGLKATLPEVD